MNKFKRVLALFMVLCMTIVAVPFDAFASENIDQLGETAESVIDVAEGENEATEGIIDQEADSEAPAKDEQLVEDTMDEEAAEVAAPVIDSNDSLTFNAATEGEIATASLTLGTKPADGTVSGEPFDESVSANHRIPGLVALNDGTLVASGDARWNDEMDGGGMDVIVSQSTDKGANWSYTYAAYLGDNGNSWNKGSSTLMDPVIVTDGTNLYLLSDIFPAGYSLGTGNTTYAFSATGTGFDSAGRLLLGTSYTSTTCNYYLENGKIYSAGGTEVSGYTVDGWFNLYQNGTYVSNLFFSDSPYMVYPTSYICMQTYDAENAEWSTPELLNVKPDGTAWQVLGPGSGIVTSDGKIAFTAYDGSNIYLIFGTSGSWKTVKTNAAVNESSIVELSDGTIRAFVKNDDNVITYVDFTKNGDTYDAGSAKSTGVANTGWCMISSMKYSKLINGKEAILVCCPSDSSGVRRYGKIYVFTLDSSNNMELLTSYQINKDFFAYSDMAEINNGTDIALLYEDGCLRYNSAPWNGNSAGVGNSHIEYTTISMDTILSGVTATITENKTVSDSATDVTVTAPDLSRLVIEKLDESTPADGYNRSVTYSIKLYHSTGALYTGSATVKVPAGELAGCSRYIGTVGSDNFEVGAPVDGYFTLKVPHFSEVTISGYVLDGTTVDITLFEGDSQTVRIDGSAYSESDITLSPEAAYATIGTVENEDIPASKELSEITESSDFAAGKNYLIISERSTTNGLLTGTAYSKQLTWPPYLNINGLRTDGAVSANSAEVWNIKPVGDGTYYVMYGDQYLTFDYSILYNISTASLTDTATALNLNYKDGYWNLTSSSGFYLSNVGGFGHGYYGASGFNEQGGSGWKIQEVVVNERVAYTDITFNGVKQGTTTATIGRITYNITVIPVADGDISDFNNIVGVDSYSDDNANATYRSDLDMSGKKITKLTISEGASFKLGIDVSDYDSVEWSVENTEVATVDTDGNVTAVAAGETTVTATVVKNGVRESISIPVVVKESLVAPNEESTSIFYYVEQVEDTTPYYTMYLSSYSLTEPVYKMVSVTEGEIVYLLRPERTAFAWLWTATPDADHALAYMASTGSKAQYYPLKNSEGELGTGTVGDVDYYKGNVAYNNIVSVGNDVSASWKTNLDTVLNAAIVAPYNCDGAMSNTRWDHDGVPKLVTSMTFISEPLPKIEKNVNGILPTTRLQKDFRRYEEGMIASVGEYVYFTVKITLERPTVWTDDAETSGAITYSNTILLDDVLPGAYFYTKELDADENGVLDGVIPESARTQELDITNALNAAWTEDEEVRTLEYYVIYEIQQEDIPKFHIDNTANLSYTYQSEYSTGSQSGVANANASITVVGFAMDNIVIDFGQSVTITGLTNEHLKYVYTDEENIERKYTANYGTVTVTKVQQVKDGELQYDGYGYPMYDYTVTYTPTSILQQPDVVQLYGEYTEGNEVITKVINGFVVYPATTVYYEEGFAFNDNSTKWTTANAKKATMEQTFELLGESQFDADGTLTGYATDKTYNYGYDPMYNSAETYFSDSYATATEMGAKTTFDITGTGFEVYADCTQTTGYVSVQIKNSAGKTVKLYIVNTAAVNGEGEATIGQEGNAYGAPIVSVRDLEHGTYTVSITKVMDSKATVYIDGIRVFNTVADSSVFAVDGEAAPYFAELRDELLTSLAVNVESSEYYNENAATILQQVYDNAGTLNGAIVVTKADGTSSDYITGNVQDWLDNGTKNELYLYPHQVLTFNLKSGVTAQIGMHAPMGSTSYSLSGGTASTGIVTSSTDMFYDTVSGTVTITNTGDKVLSITLLKAFGASEGESIFASLVTRNIVKSTESLINQSTGGSVESEEAQVYRVFDEDRYGTSYKTADALKEQLGVDKFQTVIVAYGGNFPDALAGSYLAGKENAPILMINENYADTLTMYIKDNVEKGGTIYVLGGETVIPEAQLSGLTEYELIRIAGEDRYETNLKILEKTGVTNEDILVCTGKDFADSLSASATGKPILLVGNKLTSEQKEFLTAHSSNQYYIIGGTSAVSEELATQIGVYGLAERVAGTDRYETSVKVAEKFFGDSETSVLAYAKNYPDGLCGAPLAMSMNAPLILTATDKQEAAAGFMNLHDIGTGIVLGGDTLISDEAVKEIYGAFAVTIW